MSANPRMAYAQARMQARLASHPSTALWAQLEPIQDLDALVDVARGPPLLRDLLAPVNRKTPVHRVEADLRSAFASSVRETTDWVPPTWRDAIAWTANGSLEATVESNRGPSDPAKLAERTAAEIASSWRTHWPNPADSHALEVLDAAMGLHDQWRIGDDPPAEFFNHATMTFRRQFRRHAGTIGAALAYLGLTWVALARIRGLVLLRLHPPLGRADP